MARQRARLPIPAVVNPPQRRCVTLSIPDHIDHWAAFWGVLFELCKPYSWANDAAHSAVEVGKVWRAVYSQARAAWLNSECGNVPEDGQCFENAPNSPLITWEPQNPFTQQFYVPTGYLLPPWTVVTSADVGLIALGMLPGDVLTDITRFPPGSLPTVVPPGGLPRFRIAFEGTEEPAGITVELHFVIFPAAGRALIIPDGNPIPPPAEVADMNRDLLAVPPQTSIEVVIEKNFLGAGTHTCEVQMFPAVNDAVPYLYFGGALRKIVLCGKDIPDAVAEFQVVNCVLQYRPNTGAAWQSILDVKPCIDDGIQERLDDGTLSGGQPPPDGTVAPSFCKVYFATLDGNGRWKLPIPVENNYTITVSDVRGATYDGFVGGLVWRCGDGKYFYLGGCVDQTATNAADPMPTTNHQRLIYTYDGTWHDGYNTAHTVSGLSGAADVEFLINDSTLSDNAGQLRFRVEVCNDQTFGLYGDAAAHATITTISALKWHVAYDVTYDGAPAFQPYGNDTLYYGRIAPLPHTITCVRWLITNMTGWTTDAEHVVFTANDNACGAATHYLNNTNPVTRSGECQNEFYVRGATPFNFDVELVLDCP